MLKLFLMEVCETKFDLEVWNVACCYRIDTRTGWYTMMRGSGSWKERAGFNFHLNLISIDGDAAQNVRILREISLKYVRRNSTWRFETMLDATGSILALAGTRWCVEAALEKWGLASTFTWIWLVLMEMQSRKSEYHSNFHWSMWDEIRLGGLKRCSMLQDRYSHWLVHDNERYWLLKREGWLQLSPESD